MSTSQFDPSVFAATADHELDDPGADTVEPLDQIGREVTSDFDDLADELAGEVKPFAIPIEGRPGWVAVHRVDFTERDLDLLRKKAKDKMFTSGLNGTLFASLLLASTCVELRKNGTAMILDGKPVTYTTKGLWASLKVASAAEAVRRVHGGLDGRVDASARALSVAAGWGEDVLADPTA